MGLDANLFRTKEKGKYSEYNDDDIEIGYFRKHYKLHSLISTPYVCKYNTQDTILSVQQLEDLKSKVLEDLDLNESWYKSDKVLDIVDTAIDAAKDDYIVYYSYSD